VCHRFFGKSRRQTIGRRIHRIGVAPIEIAFRACKIRVSEIASAAFQNALSCDLRSAREDESVEVRFDVDASCDVARSVR
jgi:hypothetical protein